MINFNVERRNGELGFDDVLGEVEKKPAFFGKNNSHKIIVPASSANLGCGFDSLGLAVNLYLTVEIGEVTDTWQITHELGETIAKDENNLIVATALKLVPKLLPHKLAMTSDIPLEHGLGSSSSAIVAGIELANFLGNLQLTTDDKLQLACEIEGHPDNVSPAILGGLVVASFDNKTLTYQTLPTPDCSLIAVIPDYNVSTQKARAALPDSYRRAEAVLASSRANILVAALANHNLQLAGQLMERDLFHENFRKSLIPDLEKIRVIAQQHKAYGTYLSGAGSTVMILTRSEKAYELLSVLAENYSDVRLLTVDTHGVRLE
ncbi:MAG: homoserine kinase [Streptococcaceae bacterium]|jgi:homoserine kinase|nr:homoserine kinase [Streptococcaceae bacterium]